MIHLLEIGILIRYFGEVWQKPYQFCLHYLEKRHSFVVCNDLQEIIVHLERTLLLMSSHLKIFMIQGSIKFFREPDTLSIPLHVSTLLFLLVPLAVILAARY